MEDIVAVEVKLTTGERRHFLTWGRIQDNVDPAPLAELVLKRANHFAIDGEPASARVLWSLHPATEAPYFYEYFFGMSQERIPYDDSHEAWRKKIAEEMETGKWIYYLGYYKVRDQPDEPDAVARKTPKL
jgi:hypothetical protein